VLVLLHTIPRFNFCHTIFMIDFRGQMCPDSSTSKSKVQSNRFLYTLSLDPLIQFMTVAGVMNIAYFQALPNPSDASWPALTPPTSLPHSHSDKHLAHTNRRPHRCTHCVPKLLTALQGHSQSLRPPTTSRPLILLPAPLRPTSDLH
jgi:hypothetical protein